MNKTTMEVISILLSLLILSSCSHKSTNQNAASKQESLAPNSPQVGNKPLVVDRSNLKGIWWPTDDSSPTAAFKIEDSTVYYPDQEGIATYHYDLRGDTLVIRLDGYDSYSIIEKATGDTLVLHRVNSRILDTLLRREI